MRADRLISILMLLQIHKKLTASELSERLEVSVRTIYRDIDTLSGIGVPIVADKGINGGIKLIGNYKTSITGINKNELFSLFLPTGDKILEDLGIEKLKDSTILKILGETSTEDLREFENLQNYIYIDMNTWNEPNTILNTNTLSLLQNAIWNSKVLKIIYRKTEEVKEVKLEPLGLVCKRGTWYLVAINNHIIKTYKVTSIESALLMPNTFTRPDNFNLKSYWIDSTNNFKSLIPKYTFTFKVNPKVLNNIKERPFITISETMHKDDDIYLKIKFDSLWQGVEFAFGYGKSIKIIEPLEAISEIKRKAEEVLELY
ncbi:putative DNA-binding transcriptional regulator YafY [Clostridium punense]|uniref:DNA-binding transcriptional regulator YafY n=1 Tax=Clostridium punense TaxID=1054297 RepID=A0ABS4K1B8_9CLOT|nr:MULTISPECIES: YafY family protein [Clostridium]EQB87709.1 alpha/beta hydrolase [Clostridium sp. BL8]MBP2021569.1 putative DNA-binding transcriptional regulator YafY [Clostridium punense]